MVFEVLLAIAILIMGWLGPKCWKTLTTSRPLTKFLGLPKENLFIGIYMNTVRAGRGESGYRFPGSAFASPDVTAAYYITVLLSEVVKIEEVKILGYEKFGQSPISIHFFIGAHENSPVHNILREGGAPFVLNTSSSAKIWDITVGEEKYKLENPIRLTEDEYNAKNDFGIVSKLCVGNTLYFVIAGLGCRATIGCAHYLFSQWKQLNRLCRKSNGCYCLLKFGPNVTYSKNIISSSAFNN